jgi:hypothetical protein
MRIFLLVLVVFLAAAAITAQPTVIQSFPTSGFGCVFPGGLGYDYQTDHLWVADETNKKIYEITRLGVPVTTLDAAQLGMSLPIGAGVDSKGGLLYVADESAEDVFVVDIVKNVVITMVSIKATNTDVSGLDYNPISNRVITSADGPGMIFEYDLNLQPVSSLSIQAFSGDADGMGCNTFNGLYLIGDDSAGKIIEMADDGFVMNTWTATQYGINRPEAVCMDARTGNYFVASGVNDTIYEVAGGVTLTPALTADLVTINKGQKVTFTLRTDPARWAYGGIVLIGLGGGSIPYPVILVQTQVNTLGQVTFTIPNPGLGGLLVTLVGGGFSVTPPYSFQLSNILNVTMN